jgi:hypothetical protein
VSVQWSKPHDCYVWRCIFGCHMDALQAYDTEEEAVRAFVTHRCMA